MKFDSYNFRKIIDNSCIRDARIFITIYSLYSFRNFSLHFMQFIYLGILPGGCHSFRLDLCGNFSEIFSRIGFHSFIWNSPVYLSGFPRVVTGISTSVSLRFSAVVVYGVSTGVALGVSSRGFPRIDSKVPRKIPLDDSNKILLKLLQSFLLLGLLG